MSQFGSKSQTSSVSVSGPKTAAGRTYEKKLDMQEERKLDRIAAEAQAFLLNNQRKDVSEAGSVSSVGKGTVKQSDASSTQHAKPLKKQPSVKVPVSASFSKAGKSYAHKFL